MVDNADACDDAGTCDGDGGNDGDDEDDDLMMMRTAMTVAAVAVTRVQGFGAWPGHESRVSWNLDEDDGWEIYDPTRVHLRKRVQMR